MTDGPSGIGSGTPPQSPAAAPPDGSTPTTSTPTTTADESPAVAAQVASDTTERVSGERRDPPPGVEHALSEFVPGGDWRRGDLVGSTNDRSDLILTPNYFHSTFSAADQTAIQEIVNKGDSVQMSDLNNLVEIIGRQENPAGALSALYWRFDYVNNHTGIETWSAMEYLAKNSGQCRDTANFNTYVLGQLGVNAKTIGYAAVGDINHAVTLYQDPSNGKWTLLEYTRGGHADESVYFDTMEEAAGNLIPGAFKFWVYDDPTSATERSADAAQILWTEHGLELDNFFANRNVSRPGNSNRDGQFYGSVTDRSATLSADFGKFSLDVRHYFDDVMPQIGGSFFVAGRYGDESADGRFASSVSLFAGHMPNTWSRTIGPRKAVDHSTTVAGLGFEARGQILDFGMLPNDRLRLTSMFDTSGAAVYAHDHNEGGLDKGVSGGLSYWDVSLRNQLTLEATQNVDLWLAHTTHLPVAELATNIYTGRDLENLPISNFAEIGGRFRVGSFTNETRLHVPIDINNNLFHDELRLDNTLQFQTGANTAGVINVYGDLNGFDTWGANVGVRHGNLLGTVGYTDQNGNDQVTFNLGFSF